MQPSPFKLLPALLAVAIFAHPVSASEKILFGHLFEESTAHHPGEGFQLSLHHPDRPTDR